MKNLLKRIGVVELVVLTGLFSTVAEAQIHVAPLAIYISDENPTGRIEILNSGPKSAKVTVDISYGYPQSNASGEMYMKWLDPIPPKEPSAVDWVQIYPYRFTLEPGVRQTVRFAVFAPDSIPAGEYWARPVVATRLITPDSYRSEHNVMAQLRVVRRTVLALNYRHKRNRIRTAPVIDSLKISRESNHLVLQPFIRQIGNAAVLGTFRVILWDSLRRRVYRTFERQLAVYHRLSRRVKLPVADLPSGTYQLSLEVTPERKQPAFKHIFTFDPIHLTRKIVL